MGSSEPTTGFGRPSFLKTSLLLSLLCLSLTTCGAHEGGLRGTSHASHSHSHESLHGEPYHKCIHDHLMASHDNWDTVAHQNYGEDAPYMELFDGGVNTALLETNVGAGQHASRHRRHGKHRSAEDIEMLAAEHFQKMQSTAQNLRVVLNTDHLNDDPERVCRNAGDKVKVGNPGPHDGLCRDEHAKDCYMKCSKADVLTEEKKNFLLNDIMTRTQSFFQHVLKVSPVQGNLMMSKANKSEDCGFHGSLQIPQSYYTEGVPNADFILFVTARPTMEGIVAWAGQCQHDQYWRPIAGHVNVGPRWIDGDKVDSTVSVVVHEVSHTLGFSATKFEHFRFVKQVLRTREVDGRKIARVIAPAVAKRVKAHFGCETIDGADLEDLGGRGTAGSHWEKRIFMNEIMTGALTKDAIYSQISMAIFEDSGWYLVNYNESKTLHWGRGEGCEFAEGSCGKWRKPYHCNSAEQNMCIFNGFSKGHCGVTTYPNDIPSEYRHFPENPRKGGLSALADYCPFAVAYANGDCRNEKNANPDGADHGEKYCPNCRCFSANLISSSKPSAKQVGNSTESIRPRCYEYRCAPNYRLEVKVGEQWVLCPEAGGNVAVKGFEGNLECPSKDLFCSKLNGTHCANDCSGHGKCVNERCQCDEGWMSEDCSVQRCPNDCHLHGVCNNGKCECDPSYGGVDCGEKKMAQFFAFIERPDDPLRKKGL